MRTKTVHLKRLAGLLATMLLIMLGYRYQESLHRAVQDVPAAMASDYTVVDVDDGDTIKVRMGGKIETVRFIGMDTPETHDPRKPVQCFGQEASAYTRNLLLGKQVRLESDPNDSDRDKYKRLLRYVYLGDELVNAKLIEEGYAFAYIVFPFTKLDEFRALEATARKQNKGLWAGCTVNESTKIKQTNSVP